MTRNIYDLTHFSNRAGHIGRLQCMSIIPVEAGASLEFTLDGIARLAATRKEIVADCKFTIAAFAVPLRIMWGQTFIDFIDGGPNSTPYTPPTPINIPADYRRAPYLCLNQTGAQINTALLEGYNRIFFNFWTVQSLPFTNDDPTAGSAVANNFQWFPTTEVGAENCRQYGRLVARLPHVLNGGNMTDAGGTTGYEAQSLTAEDQEVPIDLGAGTFNLTDMAEIQGRYKSKISAAWFAARYQDIMQERFGTKVSKDADPRNLQPTLLMVKNSWLSGHDVDGTDDATQGTYQGKTLSRIHMSMPRKHFNEHCLVYIMACARYPLIHTDEVHPLLKKTQFTYDELIGDPDRLSKLAPIPFDVNPWLTPSSSYVPADTIQEPYGQHYRFQNNITHPAFKEIEGYPFSSWNGAQYQNWFYYQDNEYFQTFITPQIGQWQSQAKIIAHKFSNVPGVSASYFAGT